MKCKTVNSHGEFFSKYIRKLNKDGFAWCTYCRSELNYSKKGKGILMRHSKTNVHTKNRKTIQLTTPLPNAYQCVKDKIDGKSTITSTSNTIEIPYGTSQNVQESLGDAAHFSDVNQPSIKFPEAFVDRTAHAEAFVCSFIAEHTLPLSMAPHLINFAKVMCIDNKVLDKLTMERQTATYKIRYGLAALEHKRLINDMQANAFSLNIDESTTKASKKRILNILVSYYSEELKKPVCNLYASIEMTIVNAQTVFEAVRDQLVFDNVPFCNLISVLSDSANYMRGEHNGFQSKLREVAQHMLDVGH